MSKYRQKTAEDQLPLPSPRSPRDLDEKILAHARINTPQKRATLSLGWISSMATAAVLVVAVYLTTMTDTTREPALPAPAMLEEERAVAGAAAPASLQARAKRRTEISAYQDLIDAAPLEKEELRMSATAEMAYANAAAHKAVADSPAAENLQSMLEHLQALIDRGETDQARQQYQEFRNACSECRLPETLAQALDTLPERTSPPR